MKKGDSGTKTWRYVPQLEESWHLLDIVKGQWPKNSKSLKGPVPNDAGGSSTETGAESKYKSVDSAEDSCKSKKLNLGMEVNDRFKTNPDTTM